jgi:hypothetical protein
MRSTTSLAIIFLKSRTCRVSNTSMLSVHLQRIGCSVVGVEQINESWVPIE